MALAWPLAQLSETWVTILEQELSFNSHVKLISKTSFFHFCNIAKIWHFQAGLL